MTSRTVMGQGAAAAIGCVLAWGAVAQNWPDPAALLASQREAIPQ